jgi:hypothetical protein
MAACRSPAQQQRQHRLQTGCTCKPILHAVSAEAEVNGLVNRLCSSAGMNKAFTSGFALDGEQLEPVFEEQPCLQHIAKPHDA